MVGTGGPALAVAGAALVGLGLAGTPTVVTAYARERTSDADYPRVFGFATAGLGIGQLVGPFLAGLTAQRFGSDAIMAFAAAAAAVGAAFALLDLVTSGRRSP